MNYYNTTLLLPPSPVNSSSSSLPSPNLSDYEGGFPQMDEKNRVKKLLNLFPPPITATQYVLENSFESSNGHIKRPSNCFMIFRKISHDKKNKTQELKRYNEREFSTIIGVIWKELSNVELDIYKNLSKEIVKIHQEMYPEYKYKPKRDKAAWKHYHYVPTNDANSNKKSKNKRKSKVRQQNQQETLNYFTYPVTPEPEIMNLAEQTISPTDLELDFVSTPTPSITSISPNLLDEFNPQNFFYFCDWPYEP